MPSTSENLDAHDSPRHDYDKRVKHESSPRTNLSQSEHDWAFAKRALARGDDPEAVIQRIADYRSQDKADPIYYARHTVEKAQADLERGIARSDGADGDTLPTPMLKQTSREER